MTNKLDELFDDSEDLDFVEFNIDKIKANISTYSSEKLCEMIVCDRYFGCYKELALISMEELALRRVNGDNFKFEEYITQAQSELPILDFSIPDLGTVLRTLVAQKIVK